MKDLKLNKTARQLERYVKGVSNHWRIEILVIIADNEGLTLEGITEEVQGNIKTISEHTRRLLQAGLINKKYVGKSVEHSLSPYGRIFYKFLKTF